MWCNVSTRLMTWIPASLMLVRQVAKHRRRSERRIPFFNHRISRFFLLSFSLLELSRIGCRVHFDFDEFDEGSESCNQSARIKKFHNATKWVENFQYFLMFWEKLSVCHHPSFDVRLPTVVHYRFFSFLSPAKVTDLLQFLEGCFSMAI